MLFTMKRPTWPEAASKEDKAQIPSTKAQTNSKLQIQMTKTEDGEDKANHPSRASSSSLSLRAEGGSSDEAHEEDDSIAEEAQPGAAVPQVRCHRRGGTIWGKFWV